MLWIILAILAHTGNAAVYIIDKSLLGTKTFIGSPSKYTALSGIMAGSAGILLLFTPVLPGWWLTGWSLIAGLLWVAGLWFFYSALKMGEASRVVPLAGSTVPLFTWLFAEGSIGEALNGVAIGGVIALLLGGALLVISWRGTRRLPSRTVWLALVSSAAFAGYFVTMKNIYSHVPSFLIAFAYSRVGVGFIGLCLLLALLLIGEKSKHSHTRTARHKKRLAMVGGALIGGKIMGAGALIMQNYAVLLGSVTVVSSLQGVQFALVLLLAALVSRRWPGLFREELTRTAWWQKVVGITLVSLGVVLVVISNQ